MANLRSATVAEANASRFTASGASAGASGVVLRFAAFYGPDSGTTLAMIRLAKRRIALGAGPDAYMSSITTDDAAAAVVSSLSAPAGLYNVGDDDPVTRRDFFAALAGALGVRAAASSRRPASPGSVGPRRRCWCGPRRVANGAFEQATGWKPAHRSVREGWPVVVAAAAAAAARAQT